MHPDERVAKRSAVLLSANKGSHESRGVVKGQGGNGNKIKQEVFKCLRAGKFDVVY